jgi:hypothetical protein
LTYLLAVPGVCGILILCGRQRPLQVVAATLDGATMVLAAMLLFASVRPVPVGLPALLPSGGALHWLFDHGPVRVLAGAAVAVTAWRCLASIERKLEVPLGPEEDQRDA